MRALVTGIDSFIGSWLNDALIERGHEVTGVSRRADSAGPLRKLADIRDGPAIAAIVKELRPELVFHLAAQTNVRASIDVAKETIEVNVTGTINVLEAVQRHAPEARVISMGSSAEYGDTGREHENLSESLPLAPTTVYGVSKAAQGQLARVYAMTHGLEVVHVRPFAILGPRKRGDALSDFCRNVVQIELGQASELRVGSLAGTRDFVDVRDAVRALLLLAEHAAAGETYNLCHGRATSLQALVDLVRAASRVPVVVVRDASRLRSADDPRLIGDPSKLFALGYRAKCELVETVALTLDYWRTQDSP